MYGVERDVLERIGGELSFSVGIQTPDEVIGRNKFAGGV